MKKLGLKLTLLAMPFLFVAMIELFVLPIDFFTFRCWEALLARNVRPSDGLFYPNMHLVKQERGDQLGFRDNNPKLIEWFTDNYGFRNRPESANRPSFDIVIVGDSNIVGSYLDQKDTIAEALARKCRCSTYSYGGGGKKQFFHDPRFKEQPPRAIVIEARTGELYQQQSLGPLYHEQTGPSNAPKTILPRALAVLLDRLTKMNLVEFYKSRFGIALTNSRIVSGEELSQNERTSFVIDTMTALSSEARRRGSDFVFFLMPGPDRTLDEGVQTLISQGVKTIAFMPTEGWPHGIDLKAFYQEHDSHWREDAVRQIADLILIQLRWPNHEPETQPAHYLRPPLSATQAK